MWTVSQNKFAHSKTNVKNIHKIYYLLYKIILRVIGRIVKQFSFYVFLKLNTASESPKHVVVLVRLFCCLGVYLQFVTHNLKISQLQANNSQFTLFYDLYWPIYCILSYKIKLILCYIILTSFIWCKDLYYL